MNDASSPQPARTVLTTHGIYAHCGRVMIAVSETDLVPVSEPGDVKHIANDATELLASPGSAGWTERMVHIRNSLTSDLANEKATTTRQRTYIENLGNALLEEAIRRDWCEEYDEFADEWDLPHRREEYDVTVTVRVTARDGDEAIRTIRNELGFDSTHEDVVDGPEFSSERAM